MNKWWAAMAVTMVAAGAGTEETRPISFAEARAAAERNAPDVLQAQRREGLAEADVRVAGTWANPTLLLQSARLTAHVVYGVTVPLPIFGQVSTQEDAARAALTVSRLDTAHVRSEARWGATVAWIDLREAEERARVLTETATDADRVMAAAEQRFAAGSAPRIDVVRAGADRARARAEAASADAAVRAASARLANFLRLPDGTELRAAGTPGYPRELPAATALLAGLDAHPALRRDRAEIEAAQARLRAEKRQRIPILTAGVTVSQDDPTQPGTDVIFGLSFEVPLFNFRGGQVARARADEAVARTAAEVERARLVAALRDAAERAVGAAARMRALETEVLPAMTEARRMTEDAYRDGRVDLTRLIEAQRALLDSRGAAVDAEAVWARAAADVERAAGRVEGVADAH
jgi:outer membrane protein, heavy metal efflux system